MDSHLLFESPLRITCPDDQYEEEDAGSLPSPYLIDMLGSASPQVTRQVTRELLKTARSADFGKWLETSRHSRGESKSMLVEELKEFMAGDQLASNGEGSYYFGSHEARNGVAERDARLSSGYIEAACSQDFAKWLGGKTVTTYDKLMTELDLYLGAKPTGRGEVAPSHGVMMAKSMSSGDQNELDRHRQQLKHAALSQCMDVARSHDFNAWLGLQTISRDYDELLDKLTQYMEQEAQELPFMRPFLEDLKAASKTGGHHGAQNDQRALALSQQPWRPDNTWGAPNSGKEAFSRWLGIKGSPNPSAGGLMSGLQSYLEDNSDCSDIMDPVLRGSLSRDSLRQSASVSRLHDREDRMFEALVLGLERNLSSRGELSGFNNWASNENLIASPTSSHASTEYEPAYEEVEEDQDTNNSPDPDAGDNLPTPSPFPRNEYPPLPTNDVALEESANWLATEDADFITPWYTYIMRIMMFPLGSLIFYFIYWRWHNYPRSGIWWSDMCAYAFIISEQVCFLFAMTHWVWMWNLKFRKRVTMQELNIEDEDLPTVDIMIPCYSEPTEIVEMTLKACYDIDYPEHKITLWVCDDGKSDEMKEMVESCARAYQGEMNTRYVARIKIPGIPHHAKAGNLNNIILNVGSGMGDYRSSGQLIIVLDCDMIPEPCLARTVAPFFFKKLEPGAPRFDEEGGPVKAQLDPTVALLQTPQAFYNLDTYDLLGQSYAFFYECQMSGWDGSGCTPCCGTGVTFSRTAMETVGGFSIGSITEDFKTSLNMCAHGFQCKYFLQRMTRGVSPKELNAFMIQRMRWAVGAIQILRSGNPLFTKGLHFRARWLYYFSTVGITYILFVVAMGFIMYTTILAGAPISFGPTSFTQYLFIGGTAVGLMMIMQVLAGWRLSWRNYLRALQDNFTVFWTMIRAMITGFLGFKLGFAVTSKDVSFDLWLNLRHAAPHLTVYAFSGVAMVKGTAEMLSAYGLYDLPWSTGYNVSLLYFSWLWTIFLWVMISGPPRMVLYGWRRARKEQESAKKGLTCTNDNVPALQELPSTPVSSFPPLEHELWSSRREEVSSSAGEEGSEKKEVL